MKTAYKIASQQLESEAADAIEELQAENAQLRDQNTELDKKLGELEVMVTEYQQAADKMAAEHKIERDALKLDAGGQQLLPSA